VSARLAAVALLVLVARHAAADCRAPGADCTLREAADQAGILVGAAVIEGGFATDPVYAPTLAAEFSSVTHEHVFKWDAIHPSAAVYRFEAPDRLVDFAEANGMAVRGHTLLWEQVLVDSTPAYVTAITDPATLRALVTDHIQTVVGRYRGRIDAWDVVNEPLATGGPAFHQNHFAQVLGPGYIAEAFHLAHAADPDATLFLNEVLIDDPGAKFDAFLALVRDLRRRGVPLHGVGLQGHFIPPVNPVGLQQNMERLAALGVVVELTEVDVIQRGVPDPAGLQAREYYGLAAACLAVPACRRITMWGFTDRYTWLDAFGPGTKPLPLDVDYGRKPAWFGLRDGILATTTATEGRELRVRDDGHRPERRSLRATTRDAIEAPALGGTADPTVHGGVLDLRATGFDASWDLPADGWRALGGGRGYEYRASSGAVARVLMKDGKRILVSLGGAELGLDLDVDPTPLTLALSTGNASWCLRFPGSLVFKPGKTLLATNAPAPGSCAAARLIGE
jgi:endo-1,4-beta-xylanase